jgi:hypothetical protein
MVRLPYQTDLAFAAGLSLQAFWSVATTRHTRQGSLISGWGKVPARPGALFCAPVIQILKTRSSFFAEFFILPLGLI